jgi:hypothetical protein
MTDVAFWYPLVRWAHVLVMGYWLGSELVINALTHYIARTTSLPADERMRLWDFLLDVDQHVRNAMIMSVPLGFTLASMLGLVPLAAPAMWALVLVLVIVRFGQDFYKLVMNMVVGDHQARGVDDHTRAHAGTAGHLAPFRHVELEALGKTFGKHALKRRALQWIVASASLGAAAGGLFRLRLAANDDDRRGGGLSRPTERLGEGVGMDEVVGGRLGTHGDGR